MLDELQAEAPDYEIDPLNYLLSVGQSLEEIEQYRKDGIPLWEVARAVHSIRERGESLDDSQRFIARSADEFGEDKTEFVWYPFVPVGDYTVLMADGGTGKTILSCGIAPAKDFRQSSLFVDIIIGFSFKRAFHTDDVASADAVICPPVI